MNMSKELEALNRLISFDKECNCISQAVKDDFALIEQALKRNHPVKLLKEEGEKKYGWDEWYMPVGRCPLCNQHNPVYAKYCIECGVALEKIEGEECHG